MSDQLATTQAIGSKATKGQYTCRAVLYFLSSYGFCHVLQEVFLTGLNLPSLSPHFKAQKAAALIVRTAYKMNQEHNVRSPAYPLVLLGCNFFT